MIIERIRFRNYGSFFGEHEFEFERRGLVLVLGDNQDEPRLQSNGGGKSTIFDALDWCLFGVVPRGDHVDSIVNEEAGGDCHGEVFLRDEQAEVVYRVCRWRGVKGKSKANGVSFWCGGQEQTTLDDAQTQQAIERALGLDREVFHALVLHAQTDTWNFATAGDADRIAMLTNVLQLGQIDTWLAKAKAEAAANRTELQKISTDLAVLQGQSNLLAQADYSQQESAWAHTQAATVQEAERIAAQTAQAAQAAQARVVDVAVLRARRQALGILPPLPPELAGCEQSIREALQTVGRIQADVNREAATAYAHERDATAVEAKGGGTCSACRQTITQEHVAQEASSLRAQAATLRAEVARLSALLPQWQGHVAQLEQQRAAINAEHTRVVALIQQQATAIDLEISNATRISADAAHAQQIATSAAQALARYRGEQNPWTAKIREVQAQLYEMNQRLATVLQREAALKDEGRYLDFWVSAFESKGLKNFILDARMPELTDATNHWMKLLFGGTSWVRFETQVQGRSTGKLSNKLNIRCFRYMPNGSIRERNFKSLSGGEKQRTSLAIDFGLSRLVASRATKAYDLLILDEIFKHLDSAGREAVVDLLHQLQIEKSSIFVVDHDKQFASSFEQRVVARKCGGRSLIIWDGGLASESKAESVPEEIGAGSKAASAAGRRSSKKAAPRAPSGKPVPTRRPVSRA